MISRRYLKSSTIVTSHAGIASWGERLADPMLAASLLDRLLHRGVVVAIDGPSYRMREHQQRTEQLRKAINAQPGPTGVPPTFRTADPLRSIPEREGIRVRKVSEIHA